QKNAIHGFACRKPWRVVGQGADAASAWVTGEFHGSLDAPESRSHWPADYVLRLTYRLQGSTAAGGSSPRRTGPAGLKPAAHKESNATLRLEAEVINPDRVTLPFGLGFHQYFRVPLGAGKADQCLIHVPANEFWELQDSLPTGTRKRVDAARDLTRPRKF